MSSSNMMRRIHADLREVRAAKSVLYTALPLEDDMRQWYFTIRGAPDTEFEGGIYHGRIILPAEYPFKPPNIMLLTPNGRFEVRQKICLSLSAHHPESWQPAWGIRTILEALISFLPTPPEGAVGSLDWSKKERKRAARISRKSPEKSKYIPKVYQDHTNLKFSKLFFTIHVKMWLETTPILKTADIREAQKLLQPKKLHIHKLSNPNPNNVVQTFSDTGEKCNRIENNPNSSSIRHRLVTNHTHGIEQKTHNHLNHLHPNPEHVNPNPRAQNCKLRTDKTVPNNTASQINPRSENDFVNDVLLLLAFFIFLAIVFLLLRRFNFFF